MTPRVIRPLFVLLPFEWTYYRAVATGAARFVRGVPGFRTVLGDTTGLDKWVTGGAGPVISAWALLEAQREAAKQARWPLVNISVFSRDAVLPSVVPDNREIGRLAAEHLLAAGHREFVFTSQEHGFSELRLEGFSVTLRARGLSCRVISDHPSKLPLVFPSLPRPMAVFSDADRPARRVADYCMEMGLRVPAEVAILGVDNDQLLCEEMSPRLSSVDINGEKVGFEAARLAFDLMAGKPAPAAPILIPPNGVVERESTNTRAVNSPALARAIDVIRQHAGEAISVPEIAAAARVPRRTLHRQAREHLDLSIGELVRRERVDLAKRLLLETDRTIADISTSCGFTHCGRFYGAFRRLVGTSPGAYRRQRRLR